MSKEPPTGERLRFFPSSFNTHTMTATAEPRYHQPALETYEPEYIPPIRLAPKVAVESWYMTRQAMSALSPKQGEIVGVFIALKRAIEAGEAFENPTIGLYQENYNWAFELALRLRSLLPNRVEMQFPDTEGNWDGDKTFRVGSAVRWVEFHNLPF
jgi:hypothetical protein